jgi:hypothetical protein
LSILIMPRYMKGTPKVNRLVKTKKSRFTGQH